MKSNLFDSFSEIVRRKRKIRINGKFVLFCFFLLFSSIIWYLNKLGGDYLVDLKVPAKIIYTETDKMLVDEGAPVLKIQVKTKGYTILRYKLGSILASFNVDISSYRLHRYYGPKGNFYILTSSLKSNLSTQLPSNMKIENIIPDTLFFTFSAAYTKKVPVVANTKFTFDEQYMQIGNVGVKPDSVLISGPESVIRNKRYVRTAVIRGDALNEPMNGVAALLEEKNVVTEVKEVAYTVDVAKFTERTLKLPITISNSDSASVLLIPSHAEVSFRVALRDYRKVRPSLFRLSSRFDEKSSFSNHIKVKLDTFPSFVSHIRIEPEFIEVYKQKQ
ncbi:hypothetical protein [uncultured Acetobacteroides sp.]|uniref:hypothetical protein n=1 Tax=uncultured Acetobacteroides sp. TaxID=1760811 RepID=UPI0029F5639B|nr:hypothetical protein [uncultured Acetobacteroides sp.]